MSKNKKKESKKKDLPDSPPDQGGEKKPFKKPKLNFNLYWIYGLVAIAFLAFQFINISSGPEEITWQKFEKQMLLENDVDRVVVVNKETAEVYIKEESLKQDKYKSVRNAIGTTPNVGPHYVFTIGSVETFEKKMDNAQSLIPTGDRMDIKYIDRKNWINDLLGWIIPIAVMVGLWMFIMRRVGTGPGGAIFNIGKSRASLFDANSPVKVTFKDVAGLDEAKEEIDEVVQFLKNPKQYTDLGAKIPKGVLLVGPPGTGKTLLAKAVAGEAGVPFFSLTGSDFVEMFVGVGAARVRDLFRQAKTKAPSIIFIDEIDAVGRSRGKGVFTGANDERENTLNSLLAEMDGFSTNSGVIIVAATNRPEILDSALLRPGRFDRHIGIDKPDLAAREAIFAVHLKPLKISEEIDAKKLSTQTPGFAGAEIANVCNEAALIAARKKKKTVDMKDFQDAIDRVIGGLEKKNKIISPDEKKVIAYHEAGHTVTGWYLEYAHPLVKVTIVPRGVAALGYAQYLPKEQYLYRKEQLIDEMCMTLGGRAAEELIFGTVTTGALNDLEHVTKIAYSMVMMYGMNENVGQISFYDPQSPEYSFNKPYSESTAKTIDDEVRKLVQSAFERTKELLMNKKTELIEIADQLLVNEVLFQSDIERLIGKRPFDKKEPEITETVPAGTKPPVATNGSPVAAAPTAVPLPPSGDDLKSPFGENGGESTEKPITPAKSSPAQLTIEGINDNAEK